MLHEAYSREELWLRLFIDKDECCDFENYLKFDA